MKKNRNKHLMKWRKKRFNLFVYVKQFERLRIDFPGTQFRRHELERMRLMVRQKPTLALELIIWQMQALA